MFNRNIKVLLQLFSDRFLCVFEVQNHIFHQKYLKDLQELHMWTLQL